MNGNSDNNALILLHVIVYIKSLHANFDLHEPLGSLSYTPHLTCLPKLVLRINCYVKSQFQTIALFTLIQKPTVMELVSSQPSI